MKRILIMGLPGSGKTMLAKELQDKLNCPWFNADIVREQFNDWDFSKEGRIRQSLRMAEKLHARFENTLRVFSSSYILYLHLVAIRSA
jgi:adenylate kinase family enzyme